MRREPPDWPRAVVFDLDGTLIDSATDIANALNRAAGNRGLSPFSVGEVKAMIGGGVPKLVERALIAKGAALGDILPLAAEFVQLYQENLTTYTTLYEGARELLESLKDEGRLLGLCSNKLHELTVETLIQLDIAKYFSAVTGERSGLPRKPDPAPLLSVLNDLGVAPSVAVMVGDSVADVGCAKAAGVRCVLVGFGYTPVDAKELGGDAVIASLAALPESFASIKP